MKLPLKYIILLATVFCVAYFIFSCNNGDIQEEIHYIQYPYVGPVFIYFDQKDGAKKEIEKGRRIYRILKNGTLKTKFKPNAGWISSDTTIQLFYVDSNNNILSRIPYVHIWPYDSIVKKQFIGATKQVYHGSTVNGKSISYLKYTIDTLSIVFDKYPDLDSGPGVPLEQLSK